MGKRNINYIEVNVVAPPDMAPWVNIWFDRDGEGKMKRYQRNRITHSVRRVQRAAVKLFKQAAKAGHK